MTFSKLSVVVMSVLLVSMTSFAQRNASYRKSTASKSYPLMISVDLGAILFNQGFGAAISRPLTDTISMGGFYSTGKFQGDAGKNIDIGITKFGAELTKHIGHTYFEDGVFVTGILLNTDLTATAKPTGFPEASTKASKMGYQALGGYQFVWSSLVVSTSAGYGNAASYEVKYNSATGATSEIKDGMLLGIGAAFIF